jgi:LPS sulfotransferase NodH
MVDHRGTPHAFGFKAGVAVLTGAAEVGILSEIVDRAQLIFLKRRDRVAQAVSLYKGKVSGQMHTRQSAGQTVRDDDYDGDAIDREFRNIPKTEAKLAKFAERLGKDAPIFHYEDICADPVTQVQRVCDLMGLEMPWHYAPKKVRLKVLRDGLSERWCERFRSENPASTNDH